MNRSLKVAPALVVATVVACATPAETPQEAVAQTNGRGKNLTREETRRPAIAAKEASSLYSPIEAKCKQGGGILRATSTSPVSLPSLVRRMSIDLPDAVECEGSRDGPWGATLGWRTREFTAGVEIYVLTSFRTRDEVVRVSEVAAARRDADLARMQADKDARVRADAMARVAEADRVNRIPQFQAELRVGDRVRARVGHTSSTGLVIAVNRPLAQVQFDDVTFNDSGATRWVEIRTLEPAK